jgi:F0F1-type ATP synthase membrane subunit b/b'
MTKNRLLTAVLGSSMLLLGGVSLAQNKEPVKNVSGKRHPNIARAQTQAQNAYNSVVQAQQANEFDLQGHAQKAKALLEQVNNELKLAAEASNARAK